MTSGHALLCTCSLRSLLLPTARRRNPYVQVKVRPGTLEACARGYTPKSSLSPASRESHEGLRPGMRTSLQHSPRGDRKVTRVFPYSRSAKGDYVHRKFTRTCSVTWFTCSQQNLQRFSNSPCCGRSLILIQRSREPGSRTEGHVVFGGLNKQVPLERKIRISKVRFRCRFGSSNFVPPRTGAKLPLYCANCSLELAIYSII